MWVAPEHSSSTSTSHVAPGVIDATGSASLWPPESEPTAVAPVKWVMPATANTATAATAIAGANTSRWRFDSRAARASEASSRVLENSTSGVALFFER
jgi:hypothetical protein